MAKLRRNHERKDKSGFSGLLLRVFMFFGLLVFGFIYLYKMLHTVSPIGASDVTVVSESLDRRDYLPSGCRGEVINHSFYSLCYVEEWEQAAWVAYPLTAASLRVKNVPRSDNFRPDPLVSTQSARHGDYSHSGYTRGHMAPAGDMAFDTKAMKESFYMSNMSPQLRACNGGIWRELEENVREWAVDRGSLYVVSGPIMARSFKTIGNHTKIAIPTQFYKILLDANTNESIAYIIPNSSSDKKLDDYATSVDEVEKLTNLDFFADLLEENEEQVESTYVINKWRFDDQRYRQRVNNWNKQS